MVTLEEQEITTEVTLSDREAAMLDMHSFLNILNVLIAEYFSLQSLLDDETAFDESKAKVYGVADMLEKPGQAAKVCQLLRDELPRLNKELDQYTSACFDHESRREILQLLQNLRSVYEVLDVRLGEYIDRLSNGPRWITMEIAQLEKNFVQVLSAIQTNSKGRYRISADGSSNGRHDYRVDLRIESVLGDTIYMPGVAQDILRDLIANARKYSAPGTLIRASMTGKSASLELAVADEGIGIPAKELSHVVHFGKRASNVPQLRHRGGGFGLTKAYVMTRSMGGRFWIASEQGHGTRIRISLPLPQ
ncbi:MAG: sensor histidine kinase [Verrucomicrobiota bacterium]